MKYVGKAYFKPGTGWHYSNTNYLRPRDARRARRRGAARPTRSARASSSRSGLRPHLVPADRGCPPTGRRPRLPVRVDRRRTRAAIDLSDGSAFMPFTSVVTAAGRRRRLRLQLERPRALGPGPVRRRACSTRNRSTRWSATSAVPRRTSPACPYGLGVQRLDIDGAPVARPLRPAARLPLGDALAARRGHRDRGRSPTRAGPIPASSCGPCSRSPAAGDAPA